MSSDEPAPDDDTGPLPVDNRAPAAGAAGQRRFDAPLSVNPRPLHKDRRPVLLVAVATVAVLALGVLAWLFWPSPDSEDTPTGSIASGTPRGSEVPETEASDAAAERLRGILPRGYPPGACEEVAPRDGASAAIRCQKNEDPGGPLSATYTLATDEDALEVMFAEVLDALAVVDCPGNIQSPGPWRRNATPQQVAGTLVCGFDENTSTVAWTTDSQLLLSEIQSGPQGPNMVQLYAWWSSHS